MTFIQNLTNFKEPVDIGNTQIKKARWSEALPFLLIVLSACFVFYFGLGKFPFFNPDEALYAEPAAEMLQTGNYITTTLNYVVRYTKPPICIWMMAGCYKLFGENEFAARVPGAACGVLLIIATYLLLRRYTSKLPACLGALSLLTAPLFIATGREAITDMPLAFFMATALMCFFHAKRIGKTSWLWAGYVLVGLAVMTKGPVGIALPAIIMFVYHLLKRDVKQAWKFYKPVLGLMIVGLIAAPWFITEILITKGAYFHDFILRENFQRYTSVVDSHRGGWWYHLAAMFGGYFPWSIFLPQAICHAVFASKSRDLNAKDDLLLFSLCWAIITLVFFSTSVSKLIPYTVPAFPALAILIAFELQYILEEKKYARLAAPAAILAIIYGGAGIALPRLFAKLRHLPAGMFKIIAGYISFQGLVCLVFALVASMRRPAVAITIFSVLTLGASSYFGYRALTLLSSQWEGPLPAFCKFIGPTNIPYFVYKIRKPSVTFYAHRAAALSPNQENLTTTVEDELPKLKKAYVIANDSDQKYFSELPHAKILQHTGSFILVDWSQ